MGGGGSEHTECDFHKVVHVVPLMREYEMVLSLRAV